MTIFSQVFTASVEEGSIQRFWLTEDVVEMQIIEFVFENRQSVDFVEVYGCTQCKEIIMFSITIF